MNDAVLHATCQTTGCPEVGVSIPVHITLEPDEPVTCGACQQPCALVHLDDGQPAPTPQDAPAS